MHSTNLALAINSHYCASELHCAIFMHFTVLPLTLNSHYSAFEFYSTVFIHCTDRAIIYSSYRWSSKLHSALSALHKPGSFSSLALHKPFLNSDYWVSKLHSAFLCIPQILLSLLSVISVHLSSTLLFFVCIPHTWLSLSTVIIAYVSSILLFLCIAQTLLLVLRVISAHRSSMCSSYAFHRSCSHSQCQSFLRMGALIWSFYAMNRPYSHSQQSLLYFRARLCFF